MRYASVQDFIARGAAGLPPGPLAVLLIEDEVEIASTLRHHLALDFAAVLAIGPPELLPEPKPDGRVHAIAGQALARGATEAIVNALIEALPGRWLFYVYNSEYLFYPFRETRTVGEALTFHAEERRDAMLTYVIDLYAADLETHPSAVSLADAHLDLSGYYALGRPDENGHPRERQLDFFGGLRWRFEEHIPPARRRIDRIGLFRAQKGLRLRADHTFNVEEYNTYACPWHNNLTAAICSFRTAKALKANAGSTFDIPSFTWHNSGRFDWHSQQLMDLGLMEPGQWF